MSASPTETHLEHTIFSAQLDDPRAQPLLAALAVEYTERYGDRFGGTEKEMLRYPAAEFMAPTGSLLLLLHENLTIAGGALRQYSSDTAEFKRIWTHRDFRRRGLASAVLTALEDQARRLGYSKVYLTTGPRQPEAVGLYLRTGYAPQFDLEADPEAIGHLPFTKDLAAG
ncbi:GNAT family N-acetyltransferase [Paeniglutamicibacter terrestris]|uniref:GNAT family N-acetyltransferase n=1 Tax=Paeniglutamicibacter terrestris TaxID=2723403 RepID=A0ABX1FZB4_9MICC|nr:GNAT family N-acetyltransferase [Paeniglutamicibacter terrestris]ASN38462.1 GNAT family N-acetyltransferase [Arthrobacter sp. 7749]NKG19289.1 GNAT family N-acetyltransferase [Paeniglutamicibacter terrestris]